MARRLADLGTGLVDVFVRDNKVLPPVLGVMALFIVAWLLAGAFLGEGGQKPVAHKADIAQRDIAQADSAQGSDPVAPEVENRDVDSYAAYRSKDPFREILAPENTAGEPPTSPPARRTTPGGGRRTPGGGGTTPGSGTSPGGASTDTDFDGLPDRREQTVGTDPNNSDTDGDLIPDGFDDDANGDGSPDRGPRAGTGGRGGGATGGTGRQTGGRGGGLLDSGGILPPP